jgi:hypothetical protein
MRKVFIIGGLLLGAALLPGAPAKAAVGCQCVKLGAPSICTATVADCNFNYHGVCVAPCTYEPPKKYRKHRRYKKKM